jgi:chromosome segregation ATPase
MSEKQAGQVLTGENAAEFYAERLGLAESQPEAVAEEPSEPTEEVEQSEPEAEAEAKPQEERKQNPKLERRFSEITKQREEARQEAQRERQAREALEARLAALETQKQPTQAVNVDQEPQPSQFNDAFEYAKALAEYTADKRIAEMKQEEAKAKEAAERQKVIDQWTQKVQKAKADLPDFDDIVASSEVVVNDDIRDAILESDVGPQILYHLAENDEVAKKIAGLSPKQALREIGKLEARFEAKPESQPVAKSKAPAPISPIRSSGKADLPISANGEFHGSYQAWKEARKAGRIR